MYGVEIFVEYIITKSAAIFRLHNVIIIFVRTEEALIGKPNNVYVPSCTHQ